MSRDILLGPPLFEELVEIERTSLKDKIDLPNEYRKCKGGLGVSFTTRLNRGISPSSSMANHKCFYSSTTSHLNSFIDVRESAKGIVTRDPKLNRDASSLFHFFTNYNSKPTLFVRVKGYREDEYCQWVTEGNSGKITSKTTNEKVVIDFDDFYDLSGFISSHGIIYPSLSQNVHETLNRYAESKNSLKSLTLTKYIVWDYRKLAKAIIGAIRKVGYLHTVSVSFPLENHIMTVQNNSFLAKMTRSKCLNLLCCFLMIPGKVASRRRGFGECLKAEFRMKLSEKRWFQLNYWKIISSVKGKQ